MKRTAIGISLVVAVLTLGSFIAGEGQQPMTGNPPPLSNPLKVALLKWYGANTVPTTFAVGNQPYGVAFDGANVWVANFADNTVSKVRVTDGAVLGTFPAGGFEPYGVTFDGANVWVSNLDRGTVTKLRASDGKLLTTVTVGANPGWMAFDGANLWVPYGNNTVAKIEASTGAITGSFTVGVSPIATACDGVNI